MLRVNLGLTAEPVKAGYVWISSTGRYIGAPYGGWKHSGSGREECFEEWISCCP